MYLKTHKLILSVLTILALTLGSCSKDNPLTRARLLKKVVTTVEKIADTTNTVINATTFSYADNGFFNKMDFEITVERVTLDQNGAEVKTSFTTTQDFTVQEYGASGEILKDVHTYKNANGVDVMDTGEHMYDNNGYLTKSIVQYHHGLVTQIDYEYNNAGLKIKEISTEKADEYYEYDAQGVLTKNIKGGVVTMYTYDGYPNPLYFVAHESYAHIWPYRLSKENLLKEVIVDEGIIKAVINYQNFYSVDRRIIKTIKREVGTNDYEITEYFYE